MAASAAAEDERDRSALVELLALGGAGDARGTAAALTDRLGTLAAILTAEPEALHRIAIDPRAVSILMAARETLVRALARRAFDRPVLAGSVAVADYFRLAIGHRPQEELRALFLDGANRLLREERIGVGTVDEVPVYKREIVRRVLDLNASGLILVHNHPSGTLEPSAVDLRITREIVTALSQVGVTLLDHLIVSRIGWRSIRHEG